MIKLHISKGNRKMGAIPSFSLPSGITCSEQARQTCHFDCYYRRHCERFKKVCSNGAENYAACKNSLWEVEGYLNWYFDNPNAPRLFRIHVGGDFFSLDYLKMWLRVVEKHPDTRFLAFTKRFDLLAQLNEILPNNFSLILSAWPGMEIPNDLRSRFPVAWMQDGTENRVPETAIECSGNCMECQAKCWALSGHDVVFHKH